MTGTSLRKKLQDRVSYSWLVSAVAKGIEVYLHKHKWNMGRKKKVFLEMNFF